MKQFLLSACIFASAVFTAQTTVYNYGFDSAFSTDWIMTNQSTSPPATPVLWSKASYTTASTPIFGSTTGVIPNGQAGGGNSFAIVNYTSTNTGTISNWLITPVVNVQDGDVVSIYTRKGTDGTTDYPDRLEVRYSTAATTVVPSTGPTDVGSFTNLGVSVNPNLLDGFVYPKTWTQYSFTVTGVGTTPVAAKFAFRYFVTNAGPSGTNSDIIGIDTFSVTRSTMGTAEVSKSKLSLTPNPATDFITLSGIGKIKSVSVYDMSGKNIRVNIIDNIVDVKALNSGTYIINIETDNERISEKFIKK